MPAEEWYDWPDWLILKKWSGVKRSRAEYANTLSHTASYLASFAHAYLRGNAKNPNEIPDLEARDFLPFDFSSEKADRFDVETARIIITAMKDRRAPFFVIEAIVECGLYEEIRNLGDTPGG